MQWQEATKEGKTYGIPLQWLKLHYYEALNVLFRIENALRVFAYIVLKTQYGVQWQERPIQGDDDEQGTINSIAKRRIKQAGSHGYLTKAPSCPMMHLTTGELIRLMISDTHWRFFREYFQGSKEVIKLKLDEISSVRNSLAHFRPLNKDCVDFLKQNAKQVLVSVEQFLSQVMTQHKVVPTNTEEDWYKELVAVAKSDSVLSFYQFECEIPFNSEAIP